jgi:hypothetical protein
MARSLPDYRALLRAGKGDNSETLMATSEEITLYTRPACSLCDKMKLALLDRGYRVREVNIDADPELTRRYGHDIPVAVRADGMLLAKHRLPPA